jgi:hypothetical protein
MEALNIPNSLETFNLGDSLIKPETGPGREVLFGDISIHEQSKNLIPEDEFLQISEGFNLFKTLAETTTEPDAKKFLSSKTVFANITGLEAEGSYSPQEGKILYQALERCGGLDRFAVVKGGVYEDYQSPTFIHLGSARKIMGLNKDVFRVEGANLNELTDEQLVSIIKHSYNNEDLPQRHQAIGLLSGIPRESVDWWVKNAKNLSDWKMNDLTKENYEFLESPIEGGLPAPEEHKRRYEGNFLEFGSNTEDFEEGDKIGIRGLGVAFNTTYPPSDEVVNYCQKLAEIDRRLGVSEYVYQIRKSE